MGILLSNAIFNFLIHFSNPNHEKSDLDAFYRHHFPSLRSLSAFEVLDELIR
jgi:hypothetical protein